MARVLMEEGELIGSVDEIWTHHLAYRTLGTLRMCIEGINALHRTGFSIHASHIKSYVMQDESCSDGSVPFLLDAMAEFLVRDPEARRYWDSQTNDEHWPHRCTFCGSAAFVGYNQIDCKAKCRK